MPYAAPADLAVLLAPVLGYADARFATPAEEHLAGLLLDLATGTIDNEIGQSLVDGIDDRVLAGSGTRDLVLPRWPVSAVLSVWLIDRHDGTEKPLSYPADYTWSYEGLLTRRHRDWPARARAVHAIYRAGQQVIGDDVRRICLALAMRSWFNPAGFTQERLGDHSISHATIGMELTEAERSTLGAYRAKT